MASGIWHLACQTYVQNLFQFHRSLKQTQFLFSSARSFRVAKWTPSSRYFQAMFSAVSSTTSSEISLVRSSATCSAKLSSISKWLLGPSLLFKPRLLFKPSLLSKSALFFVALLLLSYTQGSVALTAHTSRAIEGTPPYLTFDGGQTKATDTDSFFAIELPNGRVIRPSTNTSSATNPIMLPSGNYTFNDIHMVIPLEARYTTLSRLMSEGKWGDDDGDGRGVNGGVTASGIISLSIKDKDGRTVSSRGETLSKCSAPYKVTLSSAGGSITTRYGLPNSTTFSEGAATYYIKPDSSGGCYFVQYARPVLVFGGTGNSVSVPGIYNVRDDFRYAGPASIWNPNKGFLTQSTNPSSYDQNFPTTGADGLYFDLGMPTGVNASQLTWSVVTNGDITATVNSYGKVTLHGPRASSAQINSDSPSPLDVPSLPQKFELVGRDSSGNEVRYGFVLKQWFVHRSRRDTQSNQSTWCSRLGYRVPRVSDLTNSVRTGSSPISGALPHSSGNYYQRNIGSGFFTEWGYMSRYAGAGFVFSGYWTSGSGGFNVYSHYGLVDSGTAFGSVCAVCTAP
ncbi:hypothetical protein [Gilliamella sp. ESL0254]|uniref:hypothetical protein n=1 Tax=Gilliamella sp. ESL0254 TaxID=2705035 RepID=UPI0015801BB9|nr:hypothetical protein [Gilliamella sp. ESL0254]NUF28323.1 hypothetical protein [Gilliamella sp. ESL0254]